MLFIVSASFLFAFFFFFERENSALSKFFPLGLLQGISWKTLSKKKHWNQNQKSRLNESVVTRLSLSFFAHVNILMDQLNPMSTLLATIKLDSSFFLTLLETTKHHLEIYKNIKNKPNTATYTPVKVLDVHHPELKTGQASYFALTEGYWVWTSR